MDTNTASSTTERPMTAGEWVFWHGITSVSNGPGAWRWLPSGPLTMKLHDRYVEYIGLSPKGRHVHYEILRPRRRRNQAADRRWMPKAKFLSHATVCGFFVRAPSGDLTWVEPRITVGVDMAGGPDMSVVTQVNRRAG